jgi:hypothetical protein
MSTHHLEKLLATFSYLSRVEHFLVVFSNKQMHSAGFHR